MSRARSYLAKAEKRFQGDFSQRTNSGMVRGMEAFEMDGELLVVMRNIQSPSRGF
jgi:hypothetical protein